MATSNQSKIDKLDADDKERLSQLDAEIAYLPTAVRRMRDTIVRKAQSIGRAEERLKVLKAKRTAMLR